MIQAWLASGIFPMFSNGNSGPSCLSSGSPGDYAESYSAGAFDINNVIASFSSRGTADGRIKPNIAAPGVSIRSSVADGGYAAFNGTSMAAPHVAGTVALMWSAAPAMRGDIAQTRALLDSTAVDGNDTTCGGTAANNNVWGEGRLDAYKAVEQAPRGPAGSLRGTVTRAGSGAPVAGVSVRAAGPLNREAMTDGTGQFSFPTLSAGSCVLSFSAFGYDNQNATATVTQGQTATRDVVLSPLPAFAVSGVVRDSDNNPLPNSRVTVEGTPLPTAIANARGEYSFPLVPAGSYSIRAEQGGCTTAQTQSLVVDAVKTLNFALSDVTDAFGYHCRLEASACIDTNTVVALTGDDVAAPVALPFPFPFYGQQHSTAFVSTNGFLNFLASSSAFANGDIPSVAAPNGAIYPFWDDLVVDGSASVRTELLGTPHPIGGSSSNGAI